MTSKESAMMHNNQLVYANGNTCTNKYIVDEMSGVGGEGLLMIKRTVEVLEWRLKHENKNNEEERSYYVL